MELSASSSSATLVVLLLLVTCHLPLLEAAGRTNPVWDPLIRQPVDNIGDESDENEGTRWAVLVAGSNGYWNYRHQADVCHAYQILKKGGLKDENIVVFMYDDIANNDLNPRSGVIINHPNGSDVYSGVPKDYTGDHVTVSNLLAVLLGDKDGVEGGSGKVVDSKADDRIFIYYTDHGGAGVLGMPNLPYLYANDFIEALKKKHATGTYKEMVIYVEACESGSFFEGLMPEDLNIYVTTASSADESSWGTYCPRTEHPPPPEYTTCLGDLYSVSWMEDSESHNLKEETVERQYENVKERTSNFNTYDIGSHVMEYGSKDIKPEKVYLYQGFNPDTTNYHGNHQIGITHNGAVNQRDADLLSMWEMYKRLEENSERRVKLLREITYTMEHRAQLDASIEAIGAHLFGSENGSSILKSVRKPGLPLVDDWECLKSMVRVLETHCGPLTQYGMKHMRALANICNNNISQAAMDDACKTTCWSNDEAGLSPVYSA